MHSVNFSTEKTTRDQHQKKKKKLRRNGKNSLRWVYSGLQTTTNQLQSRGNGCSDKIITTECTNSNKNKTITIWETWISHTIRHRPLMPKRTHHIARLLKKKKEVHTHHKSFTKTVIIEHKEQNSWHINLKFTGVLAPIALLTLIKHPY